MLNSSLFWNTGPISCNNIYNSNVSINNPVDGGAPNTDGVNVDSSPNVIVTLNQGMIVLQLSLVQFRCKHAQQRERTQKQFVVIVSTDRMSSIQCGNCSI